MLGQALNGGTAWPRRFPARAVCLAAPVLAGCAWLPWHLQSPCVMAVIIALGVPHGALDGELARDQLLQPFGRAWFAIFAVPYLALFAGVLWCWSAAPVATLVVFLAASVWHFGTEETDGARWLEVVARGGLPVAVPILIHPAATADLFAAMAGQSLGMLPRYLPALALFWLAMSVAWIGGVLARGERRRLGNPAAMMAVFIALPPLPAFAIYFVCVHAPAHIAALIANPRRGLRIRDRWSAFVLALPLTAMTIAIGAALWPLYQGPPDVRLVTLTFQMLAALTLPHMIFEAWLTGRESVAAAGTRRARALTPA